MMRRVRARNGRAVTAACLFVVLAAWAAVVPGAAQSGERIHRIGILTLGPIGRDHPWRIAFREGLRASGYVADRDVVIEARDAGRRGDRLAALAAELAGLGVDVVVTHGTPATHAAAAAKRPDGRPIPVVFATAPDPVANGIVAALGRPGGNVTGLSNSHGDLAPKRLELLVEAVPGVRRIAILWDAHDPSHARQLKALAPAAAALGVTLVSEPVRGADDFDRVFSALRNSRADALNIFGDPLIAGQRSRIAAFTLEQRLPTMYTLRNLVADGVLMSYGTDFADLYRRAAGYVGKILKGANPADLPVERPRKFHLAVNLKTAKALGVAVPPSILLRATEVIE